MAERGAGRGAGAPSSFVLRCAPPFLTAHFSRAQRALSWSLLHPGFATIRDVVWVEVRDCDLGPGVDPHAFLRCRLADVELPEALALMTSRDVRRWLLRTTAVEGVEASCLTTVGLSNGERVGKRRGKPAGAGTINTLVHVSCALTDGAMVEAIAIVAEARTAAILESEPVQGRPAVTGTGTDCIVVAVPCDGKPAPWAGLHTAVGEAIGAAVYGATRDGAEQWLSESACSEP